MAWELGRWAGLVRDLDVVRGRTILRNVMISKRAIAGEVLLAGSHMGRNEKPRGTEEASAYVLSVMRDNA